MTDSTKSHIFFVDDEPQVCEAVAKILKREKYAVSCFNCAEDCLEALETKACNLIISDANISGMSGVSLLQKVKNIRPALPVLLVSGHADIHQAVEAIKGGAVDFLTKPLERYALLSAVKLALESNCHLEPLSAKPLTNTEKKILQLIIEGYTNREVACKLYRSIRTIEDHRHNIMIKLGVKNVVELVKIAGTVDLTDPK